MKKKERRAARQRESGRGNPHTHISHSIVTEEKRKAAPKTLYHLIYEIMINKNKKAASTVLVIYSKAALLCVSVG